MLLHRSAASHDGENTLSVYLLTFAPSLCQVLVVTEKFQHMTATICKYLYLNHTAKSSNASSQLFFYVHKNEKGNSKLLMVS